MTIGERIKKIRKASKKNLDDFGKMIDVTGPMVSMMENGKAAVIDRTIKSICREFGIREEWLRTGKGSMKVDKSRDDELKEAVERLLSGENSDFKRRFVTVLSALDEKQWAFLEEKMLEICGASRPAAESAAMPDSPAAPKNVHDYTPDEMRTELDRQLAAEEADHEKGTSEPSTGSSNVSGADCA